MRLVGRFYALLRALRKVEFDVLSSYLRHVFVPDILWKKKLRSSFKSVICQSESTRRHMSEMTRGQPHIHSITPGIEKDVWAMRGSEWPDVDGAHYLYVGRASRIRGFYVALDAMARLKEHNIKLKVLARGADGAALAEIGEQVKRRELEDRVEVIGGWLDQECLVDEIQEATAVLLPFILVPSELPVSVMEAIACGTPVITTNIDGLPSTVGKAGLIVKQGCSEQLALAMLGLYEDKAQLESCRKACVRQTDQMNSWDEMGIQWGEVLGCG